MSIRVFIWVQQRISILLVGGTLDCVKGKEKKETKSDTKNKTSSEITSFSFSLHVQWNFPESYGEVHSLHRLLKTLCRDILYIEEIISLSCP